MLTTFKVASVKCNHCAQTIKAELLNTEGIKSVQVNTNNQNVDIEHEESIDVATIKRNIEALGYEVNNF